MKTSQKKLRKRKRYLKRMHRKGRWKERMKNTKRGERTHDDRISLLDRHRNNRNINISPRASYQEAKRKLANREPQPNLDVIKQGRGSLEVGGFLMCGCFGVLSVFEGIACVCFAWRFSQVLLRGYGEAWCEFLIACECGQNRVAYAERGLKEVGFACFGVLRQQRG